MQLNKVVNDILSTGMTQQSLAKQCGCSQSTIWKMARKESASFYWSAVCGLLQAAKRQGVRVDWGDLEPAIRFSIGGKKTEKPSASHGSRP